MQKIIAQMFKAMFLIVPLVFYPKTSEVFEINKMMVIYIFTLLVVSAWGYEMIKNGRIYFKRTRLDMPLVIFLVIQTAATIFSIDPRMSLLGYYTRLNGGLISSLAFALLYWAYVSNMNKKDSLGVIGRLIFVGMVVGVWGVLEHGGHSPSCMIIKKRFDVSCWAQDVESRVFATFGQPNWMGAVLAAISPLVWAQLFIKKRKILYYGISWLMFLVLLYTKSRSGMLGLVAAFAVFGILLALRKKHQASHIARRMAILGGGFVVLAVLTGMLSIERGSPNTAEEQSLNITPSSEIRKIVWAGALEVWRHNPLLGSGVETFANAYYRYRPAGQNMTSEWNYLYNKAHNEYLNYLANSGLLGLCGYLLVVGVSLKAMAKKVEGEVQADDSTGGLTAGYVSILVSNFFGFSVSYTALLLFLYPAIAAGLGPSRMTTKIFTTGKNYGKLYIAILVILTTLGLVFVGRNWWADNVYNSGLALMRDKDYKGASEKFHLATLIVPGQALYHAELAQSLAQTAVTHHRSGYDVEKGELIFEAKVKAKEALGLAPKDVKIAEMVSNVYSDLGEIDNEYYLEMIKVIENLKLMAPSYPKVYYIEGLTYYKLKNYPKAIESLETTIELKPNYYEARLLVAWLYLQREDRTKALGEVDAVLQALPNNEEALYLKKLIVER